MKKLLERLQKQKKKIAIFLVIDLLIIPLLLMPLFSELEGNSSLAGFTFNYFITMGINAIVFHYTIYKLIFKDTIDILDVNIFNIFSVLSFAFYGLMVYHLFTNKGVEIAMSMIGSIIMLIIPISFFITRDIVVRAYNPNSKRFFL